MIKNNELDFMHLAISEARKSQHKPNCNRIHPEVGAVAVKDGMVLESAHHGEKYPCDHAEFTLLEKKSVLTFAGCTVYTTLEPCTTRNHEEKYPCATWLSDHRVSRVVIGMLDPNQAITGKGILQLRKAGIAVDLFPPDLMGELEALNLKFIREHKRLSAFYKPPAPLQFWRKRETWWEQNIESVIEESEFLAVIDSYYDKMDGSRSASEARINELGEGRSLYMTMLLGAR